MKRFLLDTHIWLWAALEPHKLCSEVQELLSAPQSELYLSPISLWELATLVQKKRFALREDFGIWVQRSIYDLNLKEVSVDWKVAHEMSFVLPNHRDPADRFLAATAVVHDLCLVTSDQKLMGAAGLRVLANV